MWVFASLECCVFMFRQANAIIMKVQSNLAASEKFFVEEQTRQSMVSFTIAIIIYASIGIVLWCAGVKYFWFATPGFTREIITSPGLGSITGSDEWPGNGFYYPVFFINTTVLNVKVFVIAFLGKRSDWKLAKEAPRSVWQTLSGQSESWISKKRVI